MSQHSSMHPSRLATNGNFAAALLDPDVEIPQGVTNPQGQPAPKRYAVYRNNVVVGLMEAMKSAFPSVAAILGEENFAKIARNFIARHPPGSAMMQHYGTGFADFIEGFPPLRKAGFLADVARLERAYLDAMHAADAPCLDAGALAAVETPKAMNLLFVRHPALYLASSNHPLLDLFGWRHMRPQNRADMADAQSVLMTRPLLEVELRQLTKGQFEFLSALARGETLGMAANVVLSSDPAFDMAASLALALEAGAFTAFAVS